MANQKSDTLIIRCLPRKNYAVKSMSAYADTHEKISQLAEETGLSLPRVLSLLVDFAVDRVEIVQEEE